MAKKVSLEEYEKNQKKKESKQNPEHKNKLLLPLEILIVLFGCSLICIVILLLNKGNNNSSSNNSEIERLKNNLNSQKEISESYKEDLDRLTGEHDVDYIENKLDFFDERVVYVIEGFGNYYYSYDCMMKKVGNNEFTYWAYNPEAAQDAGYREGGC